MLFGLVELPIDGVVGIQTGFSEHLSNITSYQRRQFASILGRAKGEALNHLFVLRVAVQKVKFVIVLPAGSYYWNEPLELLTHYIIKPLLYVAESYTNSILTNGDLFDSCNIYTSLGNTNGSDFTDTEIIKTSTRAINFPIPLPFLFVMAHILSKII
jgi:hypothetical protein